MAAEMVRVKPTDQIARRLDVSREACPMTFAKTRLALEAMAPGEVLEVTLTEGEPLMDVACSCEEFGHAVLKREAVGGGIWKLLIRRGADE